MTLSGLSKSQWLNLVINEMTTTRQMLALVQREVDEEEGISDGACHV